MSGDTRHVPFGMPAAGEGAVGLEDYVVEARGGEYAGKVATVIEKDGERFVVVEHGTPPASRDLRLVPWERVEDVDHDTLTVRIAARASEVGELARLDRHDAVEGGQAEAPRLTDAPDRPGAAPPGEGPIDRPGFVAPLAAALFGVLGLLAFAVWASGDLRLTWEWALLAIPFALLLYSAFGAYRVFRDPTIR